MEIKQFTMLAVGLIVGVLLITGVIAPVIANVTGDSGNVQPATVTYDDYTNTGDIYLMEPDGVQHEITITYADSKMTFAYDGTDFLEKSLGTEDWEVPIVEYKVTNSPYYPQYRVASLVYSSSFENLTFDGYNFVTDEISGANGLCMSITTNYNGYMDAVFISGYWSDPAQTFIFTTTKFIAQDGEYVYSKTPTVYAESLVSVFSSQYTEDATISGMSGELYVDVGGWAKLSKWQGAMDETFPHAYAMSDLETGSISYLSESFTVAVHTHASGSAYVLDDFTFNITMGDGNGGEIEYVYAVDTFIVPVIAKYIPNNGFWKMADDSETDIYTDYMGNNLYGVFSEDPSNGGKPFILEEIGRESRMLPILIGESFIGYILWEPDTYDWDAQINFYGLGIKGDSDAYAYSSTNHVHIEGDTISFTNWDNEEYTSDGLLAYISPEGQYTSFTEPTNAELSYIGFLGDYSYSNHNYVAGEMADVEIRVLGIISDGNTSYLTGTFEGWTSVDGGQDNWDETEYALTTSNTSCQINRSNGMFTGLTISTPDKSLGIPIGYYNGYLSDPEDEDLYESLGSSVFAVGLIGSNSGGGGSGSAVSPTLSTLLSVIQLLMIVGLVIGAIAFFKMRS